MARLLLKEKKKECKRYPICSSTMFQVGTECNVTEDCLSSPWKEKEKCIFTETMRYFGILDKDYQDKV